jgi:hypothetical protein
MSENTQIVNSTSVFDMLFGQKPEQVDQERFWLKDRIQKGAQKITSECVELTPTLAQILLDNNPNNRSISDLTVNTYISDIEKGLWRINGEGIIVSNCGRLIDGQHRCTAVIRSGVSIQTLIVFGPDYVSRTSVDMGRIRTPGDFLEIHGASEHKTAAAVTSALLQFEKHGRISNRSSDKSSKQEMLDYYWATDGIDSSVGFIPSKGSNKFGGKSTLAICHYLIKQRNPVAADEFVKKMITGAGLVENDPIYCCRERLIGRRERLLLAEKVEIILKTYNRCVKGIRTTVAPKINGRIPQVL